ncbi:MAG: DUF3488 and transglutaminase-like domain-containing protein [Moraxella sp.]|nr:DUF3488 and transglutaminase-like domain-containing protein [Moraxella sp.]
MTNAPYTPNSPNDDFYQYATGKKTLVPNRLPIWRKLFALPAYHWVILCTAVCVLVHIAFAPMWLMGVGIFGAIMQMPRLKQKFACHSQARLTKVYRTLQLIGFIGGAMGIWIHFGRSFSVDVSISFLLLCLISKLWELYSRRDAFVLLNLALFVLAAAFLWSQNLSVAAGVITGLMLVLSAFISLSDTDNTDGAGRGRTLAMLALPSIPLLVVLFIFFPRLPPLWSLNLSGQQATTGVSDSMSPGDFANLSKSTELAFRVEFDGQLPNRNDMYWRGMVFSDFDGITWRPNEQLIQYWQSRDTAPQWANALARTDSQYRVILEPTQQQWLFGLDYPSLSPQRGLGMTSEFNLRSHLPITQQTRYTVNYHPNAKIDETLSSAAWGINLQLPDTGNAQSRELARTLYAQANGDTLTFARLVEQYIQANQFRYTLSPPQLFDNRIDEFLFGSKAGFCEHYSSSFVFLMRAAGVPARVVAGYQGGQLGRDGKSWEVRQMDAHAWAEVWVAEAGWVRIDPTAFVSPDRIDDGMDAFTQNAGASAFGDGIGATFGYQQFRMLQSLRRYSDQMGYYWQRDIVGFDQDTQQNSLLKWFSIKSLYAQVLVLALGFFGILGVITLLFWYKNRKTYHPLDAPFVRLSRTLGKQDVALAKADSETILHWLDRLGTHDEAAKPLANEIARQYRSARYGQNSTSDSKTIAQLVKRLQDKL